MKSPLLCLALLAPLTMSATELRVNSPDGRLAFVVSDDPGQGLYRARQTDDAPWWPSSIPGLTLSW